MATNIFKLLTRPQPLPCVQAIRYSRRLPSYSRWISTDSGLGEDNQGSEDEPGSEGKPSRGNKYSNVDGFSHLWDLVFENDKRLTTLTKEFKDSEIDMHKTNTQMVASMTTGFAKTDSRLTDMDGRLIFMDGRLTFMQWQLGIIISGMITFFGFAGYGAKKLFDFYLPQIAPKIHPEPIQQGTKDVSREAGGKK
ncbi:hypothetical protein HOY82DRAFT_566906 [Tuber indicum]|nr:hypothetical protein HOY82DRAFT_566906 [Tuber indicum]